MSYRDRWNRVHGECRDPRGKVHGRRHLNGVLESVLIEVDGEPQWLPPVVGGFYGREVGILQEDGSYLREDDLW